MSKWMYLVTESVLVLIAFAMKVIMSVPPVFITALILEWKDRRRVHSEIELGENSINQDDEKIYPSAGIRALKIALAWTIFMLVAMTIGLDLDPLHYVFRWLESLNNFVGFYVAAIFSVWLIRKIGEIRSGKLSVWRAAAVFVFAGIVILIMLFILFAEF